ncbi:DUF3265 domain-containing protein [Vibrio parahaemolyticus]|nr:DUF3265 domain-containing protein [Vibrio parahaemolyticus]EGR3373826.1 hypothetical protein [Vibrio parahaemolyticus]
MNTTWHFGYAVSFGVEVLCRGIAVRTVQKPLWQRRGRHWHVFITNSNGVTT